MLVDLKTDLKSLKWGNDQLFGGSSGQPYIQTSIPDDLDDLFPDDNNDFLWRGGIINPYESGWNENHALVRGFEVNEPKLKFFTKE